MFFGYAAPIRSVITGTAGQNRYDDLAFIVAPVPEPSALALVVVAGVTMLRRRRRA